MKELILGCSVVIIAITAIVMLWKYKWELIKVSGISMYPTLLDGDIVLINKTSKINMGDIVVLTPPDNSAPLVIKRIMRVREDKYWVVGDNRDHSHDSRYYGWVDRDNIEGKVIKTWKTKKQ